MKSNCSRCGKKTEETHFTFYEVDGQDRKHKFGTFCIQCTTELLEELKGKVEWFHIERGWKGYIHPEAKPELERTGLIHPRRHTQFIEINYVGRNIRKADRTDAMAILRVRYGGGLVSKEEYEKLLKKLREVNHQSS